MTKKLPPGYEIRRKKAGEAYARSGNAHSPTPRYRYELYIDGKFADCSGLKRNLLNHYGVEEKT